MKQENFDTPQWQEYFKDKSPEEIEEIKILFEEKKEIPGRSRTVEKGSEEIGNELTQQKIVQVVVRKLTKTPNSVLIVVFL